MKKIIPSVLHKVAHFESRDVLAVLGRVHIRLDKISSSSLESQINSWVEKTRALITMLGPVHLMMDTSDMPREYVTASASVIPPDIKLPDMVPVKIETRTVLVGYVPSVEDYHVGYGERFSFSDVSGASQPVGTSEAVRSELGGR